MEILLMIFVVFSIFTFLVMIWRNFRELLAKNSTLENLSKRKLLNSIIYRGLYTIMLFATTYLFLSGLKKDTDLSFYIRYMTIWYAVGTVEAFIGFLIPCKELIKKL
jgi:hypothetical protein